MRGFVEFLRWVARIAGGVGLILGLLMWIGRAGESLRLHMWLGFALTFDLMILVVLGFFARVKPVLPLITVVWAVVLPVLGIAQLRILIGSAHWLVQVLHLMVGVGAIGLAEVLGKRITLSAIRT